MRCLRAGHIVGYTLIQAKGFALSTAVVFVNRKKP